MLTGRRFTDPYSWRGLAKLSEGRYSQALLDRIGDFFDITGTSEHLGVVESDPDPDTELVSSPYFCGNVHYGVTASAGAYLDYGMRLSGFGDVEPMRS